MKLVILLALIFFKIFNALEATDAEYNQLREFLKTRTVTQEVMADRLGVSRSTISRVENGEKSPKALKKAKEKYPNIFQQTALPHPDAAVPITSPIVKQEVLPIVKRETVISSQYLALPNLKAGSKYVISMVPMNSSGDSYHILAYLILGLSHQKAVPDILLTYDGIDEERKIESKMNAYTQVQRTLHFAQVLGYGEYFKTAFIDTGNCQRENNRQSKLEEHLSTTQYTHYIDQKALTTIISEHFRSFGRDDTTQRLRDGFNKYSAQYLSESACRKLVKDARDEVQRIKSKSPNPLIVMHVRHSSKANKKQNMEGDIIGKLSNYVKSKGYNVWFIFTDGRTQKTFKSLGDDRTDPFPFFTADGEDNGKYFHLQLLLNLRSLPNLRGIIGNTSGTLDLAGFLGHNVYNLHNVQQAFDYQSCRILIQSSFLTVERLNFDLLENALRTSQKKLGELDDATAQEHLPNLSSWMADAATSTQAVRVKAITQQSTINSQRAGYWELFFIKKLLGNSLDSLQAFSSTVTYLQGIDPTLKIME